MKNAPRINKGAFKLKSLLRHFSDTTTSKSVRHLSLFLFIFAHIGNIRESAPLFEPVLKHQVLAHLIHFKHIRHQCINLMILTFQIA